MAAAAGCVRAAVHQIGFVVGREPASDESQHAVSGASMSKESSEGADERQMREEYTGDSQALRPRCTIVFLRKSFARKAFRPA
jgi:hypothetical protein